MGLVGRGEDLGLVDEVNAEGLQDLGLHEVPDARLGHHGDADGRLDPLDHLGVAHAGHTAVTSDVGGNPLEGHDGARPRILGDTGLLGGDHIHDHAAAEHLRQTALDRC